MSQYLYLIVKRCAFGLPIGVFMLGGKLLRPLNLNGSSKSDVFGLGIALRPACVRPRHPHSSGARCIVSLRRHLTLLVVCGAISSAIFAGDLSATEALMKLSARVDTLLLQQDLDSAFALVRYGLATALDTFGPTDTATATWYNYLAICHFHAASLDSAEMCWTRALDIWMTHVGPDHPLVAKTYNNLGTLLREQGRFSDAIPLLQRALVIWEGAFGHDDPRVAPAANNLAYTLYQNGDLIAAEPLFKRANRLWSFAWGASYPHAIRSRINLGMLYTDQGRFTEAEQLFRETLHRQETSLGKDHPDIAYNLNNLAQVCWAENRRLEATRHSERALAIYEAALGPAHPYLAYGLSSLARMQRELGDYAKAEAILRRALDIARTAYGEEHLSVAQSLNDLGIVYEYWGRFELAEQSHRKALAIREGLLGPRHPQVAQSWHNLAAYYLGQDQLDQAASLNRLAHSIWEENYGGEYYQIADCLLLTAAISARRDNIAGAADAAWRALVIRRSNFEKNAVILSEHDALHFARLLREATNRFLSYAIDLEPGDKALTERIADAVVSTKGQVADQIFLRRTGERSGDVRHADVKSALKAAKFRLASLYFAGPNDDVAAYRQECDRLGEEIADYESELARRSGSDYLSGYDQPVRFADIRRARPTGATLVEYMRFTRYNHYLTDSSDQYLAIVFNHDDHINIVNLESADRIDPAVRAYRQHVTDLASQAVMPDTEAVRQYRTLAGPVYDLVCRPLQQSLDRAATVFVAGDGLINLIPVGALPSTNSRYVIEDHTVHYVSALRDIVRMPPTVTGGSGLLAIGDPDFFASSADRLSNLSDSATANEDSTQTTTRSLPVDCPGLDDLVVSPLPGTRAEVNRIAHVWERASHSPATVLLGAAASEELFKRHSSGHQVPHLATHGYYLPADCGFGDSGQSDGALIVEVHPLLRSGLLLAGANLHQRPGPDDTGEDGNLSAYEVAELDLTGTRLVVLSACETGLGEIMEWEGVYGLRRAFLLAGAAAVVSALWSVSDDHTVDLMSRLYEGGIDGIAERLQRTQLERLRKLRESGIPDHPVSWGAFIAVGDWR